MGASLVSDDIKSWLERFGFGKYADAFAENEIDFRALLRLTEGDLKELGLPLGARRNLQAAIEQFSDEDSDLIAAAQSTESTTTGEAERRQLTIMFCDLVGSTQLSTKLDPEDLREINRAYQEACKAAIERFDGYVARYMGDGVLAYFGYPQAHEDDAERAVRAGLALTESVASIDASAALAVRVGIATGPVVVGDLIGEGASQESAVVGETPNLAARLQAVAEPNTVVIAPATWRLVGTLFEYAGLGDHAVKGFDEPVRLRRVLRESKATTRFETQASGLTPLVGRDAEIAVLNKRWEQAIDGQGQVVVLTGEPGIGKSRLIQGFQASLGRQPRNRVLYHCSAHHQQSAFYPAIEQLRRVLLLEPGDSDEATLKKLEATLELLDLDVVDTAPPLAELLSLPVDRYPEPTLDPQQRRERLLHTLIAVFERMAMQAPVLLVVEDVHWADPSTRELLSLAVEELRQARVLLLSTARPEFESGWRSQAHVTTLSLNHLGRQDTLSIIRHLLHGRTLPSPILEQIAARAEGVPLYAEELTKAVLEAGQPDSTATHDGVRGSETTTTIPASLHDSLMARLDRLGSAKELAQLGSTLGRTFSHELLAEVWPHDTERLQSALGTLLEADLLQRRGRGPHTAYMFKHTLLMNTAYEALLKSTRRRHHSRIAEVLVERFPSVTETEPETVAHHFAEAQLPAPAFDYWCRAGHRAWDRSASLEAVAHLERGLEQAAELPSTEEVARQELDLRVTLGAALGATAGWAAPEVEENYLRAQELCKLVGNHAQQFAVTWGLWLFSQMAGQMARAKQLAKSVMQLAEGQPSSEYRLQAHHATWTTATRVADFGTCISHAEQGVTLYDPKEHRHHAFIYGGHDPGVCALCNLAVSLWARGHPQQALARVAEAKRLTAELAHPFSHVMARFFVAHLHQLRGEAEPCLGEATELVSLSEEQGFLQLSAAGAILRGWALAVLGEEELGISTLRNSLSAYQRTGADARSAYFLTLLAQRYWRAGRIDEARSTVMTAHDVLETSGESTYAAEVYRIYGEVQAAAHDVAAAEEWLGKAISLANGQGALSFQLRATTSLARLRHSQSKITEARALLTPVYGWFTEGFDTPDLQEAKALLEQLS